MKLIERMRDACTEANARFVLVYAPTKAHVVMPIVADRLPVAKVRSFASLALKEDLPGASAFLSQVVDRSDGRESVVRFWCEREGNAFISTTEVLRSAVRRGIQTYFTYDQHWTPLGHEAVAELVSRTLGDRIDEESLDPPTQSETDAAGRSRMRAEESTSVPSG